MSVPANIAEGSGRGTSVDFAGFLDRARGSLFELDMWLYTTQRRGWLSDEDYDAFAERIHEVNAMLFALRDTLRNRETPARRNL
jgi:four helix bundle protein